MPGGGGAGAHPPPLRLRVGLAKEGTLLLPPRPCPLCRGSRGFAGVLGRCWFRSSQPWPRGPSGGPSAATAPSSALAAGLQAGGTRLADPQHTRVQHRGAPPGPFLSFQKERKPAARESGSLCVSEK